MTHNLMSCFVCTAITGQAMHIRDTQQAGTTRHIMCTQCNSCSMQESQPRVGSALVLSFPGSCSLATGTRHRTPQHTTRVPCYVHHAHTCLPTDTNAWKCTDPLVLFGQHALQQAAMGKALCTRFERATATFKVFVPALATAATDAVGGRWG